MCIKGVVNVQYTRGCMCTHTHTHTHTPNVTGNPILNNSPMGKIHICICQALWFFYNIWKESVYRFYLYKSSFPFFKLYPPARSLILNFHWPLITSLNICFVVQLLSHIRLFGRPWTAAHQASLSSSISWCLLKLRSIKSVMLSNHLILCHPLLLLASIFPIG